MEVHPEVNQTHGVSEYLDNPRLRTVGRRALAVLGLSAAAYTGGFIASAAFQTTTQVGSAYELETRASLRPSDRAEVSVATPLQPVVAQFDKSIWSPPGLSITPMLQPDALQTFSGHGYNVNELAVTKQDISRAVQQASLGLAEKFIPGALGGSLLALGAMGYRRRNKHEHWATKAVGVASGAGIAVALAGGQAYHTYTPDSYTGITASGVAGELLANKDLFTKLHDRAAQTAPYVAGAVGLVTQLQQELEPAQVPKGAGVKFMLVSDLHGYNDYSAMLKIAESQGVAAVIDSGDIVNFGQPSELTATSMPTGIRSLTEAGIPYIFSSGNHDGSSSGDYGIVDAIAKIKGAYVLQPSPSEYQEVTVGGVRIAGFNDPRYFGDDNKNNAAKEQPALEQFNRTLSSPDIPEPDIGVAHEPSAADGIQSVPITINGHMHKPAFSTGKDSIHIQVGTFTKGGLFENARASGVMDDEVPAAESSFSVLTIGSDCNPAALDVYTMPTIGFDDNQNLTVQHRVLKPEQPVTERACGGNAVETKLIAATPSATEAQADAALPRP